MFCNFITVLITTQNQKKLTGVTCRSMIRSTLILWPSCSVTKQGVGAMSLTMAMGLSSSFTEAVLWTETSPLVRAFHPLIFTRGGPRLPSGKGIFLQISPPPSLDADPYHLPSQTWFPPSYRTIHLTIMYFNIYQPQKSIQ